MKNLFVSLMFITMLFVSNLTFAETITITVNNKDYNLTIPDNQKDLRTAFINISKNYIQAENDNTKLLAITDTLKADVKDLSNRIDEAIGLLNKKVRPEFWQTMMFLGLSYNLQYQTIIGNIEVGGLVFEKFYIGLNAGAYPFNVGLSFGWKF